MVSPVRAAGTAALPANQWVLVSRDDQGARRFSSFRYVAHTGFFLQWGFMGHVTEFFGDPETPLAEPPEYDLVFFDMAASRWQDHLPLAKQQEWSRHRPPMHMCGSYQGITNGSRRPGLKVREGVLRPDLNIVYDQLAYDARRHRMIYFTGGRTLAYDIDQRRWSDIASGVPGPPPVAGGTLVYDPPRDQLILFGGGHVAETDAHGQIVGYTGTWSFDCARGRWERQRTAGSPPPRMDCRLVYVPGSDRMVLFGGDAQTHFLADTWIFDPKTRRWTASRATAGPAARAGHFTVVDPRSGWMIIGGGHASKDYDDMWGYDVSKDRWHRLVGQVPRGWYITADLAPSERCILLTTSNKPAGDTHSCNEIYSVRSTHAYRIDFDRLVDPALPATPARPLSKRGTPAAQADAAVGADDRAARQPVDRLAAIPANRWVRLPPPRRAAPLRTWGSCSFDTRRGRIVYWGGGHCGYGGNDYDFFDIEDNTWIASPAAAHFPSRSWDKGVGLAGVTFGGSPWVRHGRKVYAYDPVSDRVINMKKIVLTAGYDPQCLRDYPLPSPPVGDELARGRSSYTKWVTWGFDIKAGQWSLICPARPGLDLTVTTPHGVMAVDYHWSELDPGNRQQPVSFEANPKENAVYLLDVAARQWRKLSHGEPGPQNLYEMTALVYDAHRDRLLLHGGGPERDELWEFELRRQRWARIESDASLLPGGTPPHCNREAVYIPGEDVLLTAGATSAEGSEGLYAYHAGTNRWHPAPVATPEGVEPSGYFGQNRALTYDPRHDLVLMVLGKRSEGDAGQARVYALRYRDAPR